MEITAFVNVLIVLGVVLLIFLCVMFFLNKFHQKMAPLDINIKSSLALDSKRKILLIEHKTNNKTQQYLLFLGNTHEFLLKEESFLQQKDIKYMDIHHAKMF